MFVLWCSRCNNVNMSLISPPHPPPPPTPHPQAHCELLELTNSVFLACALSHMHQQSPQGSGGGNWCAITDPTLCTHASTLFKHIVKLMCVFVHVIEQKEPEVKDKVGQEFMGVIVYCHV